MATLRNLGKDHQWLYMLLIAGSLALRIPHLRGPIDDPHSWRQSDTANYALDFDRYGFELLRPQICWSGRYSVLALEFPLHEAIVGLLYRLLGVDHLWARLTTLAFFAGSLFYLFQVVALVSTQRLAWLTAVVYSILPMSLFYSRAIHIDFCAVFFAHAMLFHLLYGFDHHRPVHIVMGVTAATIGFVVKAPYLFYLYLPLGVFLWRRQLWRTRYLGWLAALVVPLLALFLWRWNVAQVNGAKPSLDVYPDFVDRLDWYFGSVRQRLDMGNWLVLLRRLILDVANPVGILLLAWGFWGWLRAPRQAARLFFGSWTLGLAVYVLIFFNLNWAHNYYQIPLLAMVAYFIASSLDTFVDKIAPYGAIAACVLLALLVGGTLWYADLAFYHVDWRAVEAGQVIREHTTEGDLIVVFLYDDNFEYSDPRLLYRAHRHGWSIQPQDITPERIALYASEGARFLAITESQPDDRLTPSWLRALPGQHFPLYHGSDLLGTLHLYDLSSLTTA